GGGGGEMRGARKVREALQLGWLHRGYARLALRPASVRRRRLPRELTAGGVIVGPKGARSLAVEMVRTEIAAGCYVTDTRLAYALDRLLARL
ncbi:MAG TPA: hypothetical protein PK280_10205, partial [Planctomycetota bacterium]|nr:hypothetical protein [Planctomycetota bacterium]